ncbi:TrbG/VirB9 family P-type conjugative transfer protein [Xanthobacter sp. TB0136]|uniref:TrbG/VirB9 family P-type conjugative transfer protein n=1 Tax=Xanthobacter sp. TB0136 TaxID=3459177 RepID=UPI00403A2EBF
MTPHFRNAANPAFRKSVITALLVSTAMLGGCASAKKPPAITYDSDVPPLPAVPAAVTDTTPKPIHIPPAWTVSRGGGAASTPTARVENANLAARVEPRREGYYNAIQVYPWSDGALYQIYASPGQITNIALEPGESLTGTGPIAAGDTARWIIGDTESGSGETRRVHVLVKPSRADISTNLVITGLGWVHRNRIIHRDVTADNIMLASETAKLSDFGAAQHQETGRIVSDLLYGPYIPPETVAGAGFSVATDIFGMGLTLLRAANNQYAFHTRLSQARKSMQDGENIADVVGFQGYVPEKLKRIIRKAVASDPACRYSTAGAFRQDLSRLDPVRYWRLVNESTWTCEYAGKEEIIRLYPAQYATVLHTVGGRTRAKTVHASRLEASNHMLSIVAKSTLQ